MRLTVWVQPEHREQVCQCLTNRSVCFRCVLFRSVRSPKGKKGKEEREGGTTGLGFPILKSLGPDNGPLDSNPRALDPRVISLQQGYASVPCRLIHYAALLFATYDIICTKALQCRAVSNGWNNTEYHATSPL